MAEFETWEDLYEFLVGEEPYETIPNRDVNDDVWDALDDFEATPDVLTLTILKEDSFTLYGENDKGQMFAEEVLTFPFSESELKSALDTVADSYYP